MNRPAADWVFLEVAQLLVQQNATVDVPDHVTGKTALIKASYVGHADVADLLLEAGADKDAMDNQGCAASTRHMHAVEATTRTHAAAPVPAAWHMSLLGCPRPSVS